eukprot:625922-Prymnesium_polylepis.1
MGGRVTRLPCAGESAGAACAVHGARCGRRGAAARRGPQPEPTCSSFRSPSTLATKPATAAAASMCWETARNLSTPQRAMHSSISSKSSVTSTGEGGPGAAAGGVRQAALQCGACAVGRPDRGARPSHHASGHGRGRQRQCRAWPGATAAVQGMAGATAARGGSHCWCCRTPSAR